MTWIQAQAAATASETILTIGPHEMAVDVIRPAVASQGVALVLHTSRGLEPADREAAARLAAAGFTAAIPHFMEAYAIGPRQRQETWTRYGDDIYRDLQTALGAVARAEKLDPARSVAVGFSNGGYWAAYLAAKGDVRRAVSFYGAYSQAGADKELAAFRAALSPRSAPLLAFHGDDDDTVPVRAAQHLQELAKAKGAPLTLVVVPGAGHRFERDGRNGEAAADAWQRALGFLQN